MTQSTQQTNYQRILNFIDMIKKKPKKDVKYFFLDEGRRFVIDGTKLRLLPIYYHKYYVRHEFYVHIDPVCRRVQYYAFDRTSLTDSKRTSEAAGSIPWDKEVENSIYNFFVSNIRDLTSEPYTYSETKPLAPSGNPKTFQNPTTHHHAANGYAGHNEYSNSYTGYKTYSSYGSPDYKLRESFLDKLRDLQKDNLTTKTIDFISDNIATMRQENKTNVIDDILHAVYFGKMPIPVILGLVSATKGIEDSKEWTGFLKKVKDHITKVNPRRASMVLKGIE
jgi:hypothetical protein